MNVENLTLSQRAYVMNIGHKPKKNKPLCVTFTRHNLDESDIDDIACTVPPNTSQDA